ncbi:MAG: hypothetical protein K9M94_15410, partial [Spirochaetia bacterium]|nr:hypothetical protein [Spirochaetia bacterium]
MKVKEREHRIVSFAFIALFHWTITAYFVYNIENLETLNLLLPVSCIGLFFFPALNFHFVYSLTLKRKMPLPLFLLLYSPAVLFSVINYYSPFTLNAVSGPAGDVVLIHAVDSPWHFIWFAYYSANWLLPAFFYLRLQRRSPLTTGQTQLDIKQNFFKIPCV